jgi:uncharacterized protein (UPF0147 family)
LITPLTSITGDKELDRVLKALGREAIKDSQIKQGLRKIAKPFIQDIRKNINDVTKNLSKSIGILKKIKSKKGKPFIIVGPRYYGSFKGYHAHLVEAGNTYYDVEFKDQRNIERAYNKNKTKALTDLNKEIVKLLDKKLKKLKG